MLCPWTRYSIVSLAPDMFLTRTFQHRARFLPNMFHRESPQDATKHKSDPSPPGTSESNLEPTDRVPSNPQALGPKSPPPGPPSTALASSDPIPPVLEVWFAGCHSDVGGGAVEDTVRYSLAGISLRWMVKQIILSQCGIRFNDEALRRADIDISTIMLVTPSRPNVEVQSEIEVGHAPPTSPSSPGEDDSGKSIVRKGKDKNVEEPTGPPEQDVLADIHDELKKQPMWWPLEILPVKIRWQEPDGTWKSTWRYTLMKLHSPF